ncbi:hypothetical protein [Zavarzinella formosa]|uniref:hypothetical protein n=1 Tax=Zavarzinella formosa TaxID=360055 RepID=UPI0003746B2F|nr:hypothetical protein [Zavarzinella formosa]
MSSAKVRMLVAGGFFFLWLGWLGYLAATKANPLVVSRAQLMASSHFVLAEIVVDPETGKPNIEQQIKEELKPHTPPLAGKISIVNLREARIAGQKEAVFQPGTVYLLPLTKLTDDMFELTPPPKAPGNEGFSRGRPWAYPWIPAVQRQFEQLVP